LQVYYIQKWVDRPPRDVRVMVVGDEVVAASYRYSPSGDWRTNVARGGRSEACPLTPELEELALKASKAVGGGVLAVDCMESRDEGLLVHEVNNTVEFKGLASTTDVNLAEKIIDYTVRLMKR
ncbi:MAG: RimK family alpha-L-glutamate ligase, partial [Candidatus Bathyarchaeia archaeon]